MIKNSKFEKMDGYFGKKIATENVDIVIDGYPRSGNTFAAVAMQLSQKSEIKIAHHYHTNGQITRGINLGKPVVLLIRNPVDAVASYCIRERKCASEALEEYCGLYSPIIQLSRRCVIAEFDRVTSSFDSIILEVNERFGCAFDVPVFDKEFSERCIELIEKNNARVNRGVIDESKIARPSDKRASAREALFSDIQRQKEKLNRAKKIYEAIVNG